MGEIADMMLSGELCECCGVFIDDKMARMAQDVGIPSYCSRSCARDSGAQWWLDWEKECNKPKKKS